MHVSHPAPWSQPWACPSSFPSPAPCCPGCRDDGVGLAAPQVGVNIRLMVFNETARPGAPEETVLVNPTIIEKSRLTDFYEEGCLSFPKMYGDVEVSG